MAVLTEKQKLFVTEYIRDFNATQAAARAGYSDASYGRQLLTKPHVQAAVSDYQEEAKAASVANLHECCSKLTEIIRADIDDFIDADGNISIHGKPNRRGVQELTQRIDENGALIVKIKMRDPVPAMARLAAFMGMDKPKEVRVDGPIEVVVGNSLEGLD